MADERTHQSTRGTGAGHVQGSGAGPASRCVVLTGRDGAAPVDLLGGLSRRGVGSRVVAEPAEVMVQLGLEAARMLIVVDPARQPAMTDLIEAVNRYHPRTVCWVYEPDHRSGKPQLLPYRDRTRPEVVSPKPARPRVESLTTEDPGDPDDAPSPLARVQSQVPPERVRSLIVKVQGPAEVGEPLISEEELAMLLGPVPEESGGQGGT